MDRIKLQKKRQRKEAKRIAKHKTVRKALNQWNGLGKDRQSYIMTKAQRKNGIKIALSNLEAMSKKWNDKIPVELIEQFKKDKEILLAVVNTRNVAIKDIDEAVKNFVPLNDQIFKMVQEFEGYIPPVPKAEVPVEAGNEARVVDESQPS